MFCAVPFFRSATVTVQVLSSLRFRARTSLLSCSEKLDFFCKEAINWRVISP
ncbi:Uncharacterised protein [Shigella sonnei]|nr:Uncharacterised protein [Shigella sonnei]